MLSSASGTPSPAKPKKRRIRPWVGIPLMLLGAAGLYGAGLLVRGGLVLAAGEPNGCRYSQLIPLHALRFQWALLSLLRSTKAEAVPGTNLAVFRTPQRDFYAPRGTALGFVLAEQQVRVYGDGQYRVRPGDIVLDCGANTGTFVHEALAAGARLVVAIDPSPGNVEAMRRTFAREAAEGRVIIYPKGVWDRDEVLEMNVFENSALDSFVMQERTEAQGARPNKIRLPLTTIDKIVAELRLERVDYIKMDIEGAERRAIAGGAGTIRKHRPRMSIATENLDDDYREVPKALRAVRADYVSTCMLCRDTGLLTAKPDVLHFN